MPHLPIVITVLKISYKRAHDTPHTGSYSLTNESMRLLTFGRNVFSGSELEINKGSNLFRHVFNYYLNHYQKEYELHNPW